VVPSNYRRSWLPEATGDSMVRPRFAKLPQTQRDAILRAALDEFAAHGFHDASLNRVIEAAGISKGSMYY
jgi:AcrR family transcriptional regulator